MPKVELCFIEEVSRWNTRTRLEVKVDGKYVGGGSYGGEPEDNSRSRDYHWVESALQAVATNLGASVEVTNTETVDV